MTVVENIIRFDYYQMFSIFVSNFSGRIDIRFGCKKDILHFYTPNCSVGWRSKKVGRYSVSQSLLGDTLHSGQNDSRRKNAQ